MSFATYTFVTLVTFALMEPLSWALHRYVMHGIGWRWHRSHHEPHSRGLERNDLYALSFAALSVFLFALGYFQPELRILWCVALGSTLYGTVYFVLHDCLIHQRVRLPFRARSAYLQRLIKAHRLHHATRERDGAVSFGFLYAPPPALLARTIRARRERSPRVEQSVALRA